MSVLGTSATVPRAVRRKGLREFVLRFGVNAAEFYFLHHHRRTNEVTEHLGVLFYHLPFGTNSNRVVGFSD